MPELPEVETVRRGLADRLVEQRIGEVELRRDDLRFPFPDGFAESLEGKKILAVERRAKYLLIRLEGNLTLLAHLGMSGRFHIHSEEVEHQKHDHVRIALEGGDVMIFNDARRFGMMDLLETGREDGHYLLKHLGPEPLGDGFNAGYLREALSTRKTAVKLALMDQKVVVGVGNIYACEALFMAGLHPACPSDKALESAEKLVSCVKDVLLSAIDSGGSSLRDFLHADGHAGYFQHRFQVYGREGSDCYSCKKTVERVVQGGRSTFYCSACQTMPENARLGGRKPRQAAAHRRSKKTVLGG